MLIQAIYIFIDYPIIYSYEASSLRMCPGDECEAHNWSRMGYYPASQQNNGKLQDLVLKIFIVIPKNVLENHVYCTSNNYQGADVAPMVIVRH